VPRELEEGALLTLAFAAKVAASPRHVWRALTSSASAAHWLPSFEGWIDPPPEALAAGARLRFRARLRDLPTAGELRIREVTRGRVRLRLRLGLLAFDARFSVVPESGAENATHLGLAVSLESEIAVVGGSLDRFSVRELASRIAKGMLAALAVYAEKTFGESTPQ
jgi:hypothetical protein